MSDDKLPDNDEVICPNCVHQFRAIPVNVQSALTALQGERDALHELNAALCDNDDNAVATMLSLQLRAKRVERETVDVALNAERTRRETAEVLLQWAHALLHPDTEQYRAVEAHFARYASED